MTEAVYVLLTHIVNISSSGSNQIFFFGSIRWLRDNSIN